MTTPDGLAERQTDVVMNQAVRSADEPEAPTTSNAPAIGNESEPQQERSQGLSTTGALDGDYGEGSAAQAAVVGGTRAMEFLTPRSAMTTVTATQNNWMGGLEVPRWVTRLGSYLAQGLPLEQRGRYRRLHLRVRISQLKQYKQRYSDNWVGTVLQYQYGILSEVLQALQGRAAYGDKVTSGPETKERDATAEDIFAWSSRGFSGYERAETAMKFQDWLELTTAVMCDVSEQSGSWWRRVLQEVEGTYRQWLGSTPLERLSVQPAGEELSAERWLRLNARVSAMLLGAMSPEQQAEMVSHRISTSAVKMLYRLHTLYQPGGSHEREDVLRKLQSPADNLASNTLPEVLRSWPRWIARCASLQMVPPDSSVLARGLKLLTSTHLEQSQDAAFRTAMVRTSLRLDGQPRMEDVYAYQRHLQAEIENLLASRPAATTAAAQEQPRLRALERPTAAREREREKGKDKDKGSPTSELCRYFLKPSGCKRGAKCTYSHSMATLDRETRNKKCLLCGAEGHRQRDCTVGKSTRSTTTPSSPANRDQRPQRTTSTGTSSVTTATPSSTLDSTSTASVNSVQGVPWTLENLIQAAQQVVQNQGSTASGDSSPEKTKPELRTMRVQDVRICSVRSSSAALLDSGATHCLRNAYDYDEWNSSESVLVHLAGNNQLVMKLSESGSLLMPPRSSATTSTTEATAGQTIVPMGELVRTLGYTLIWGPGECCLEDAEGTRTSLNVSTGCPQLCEAAALALIAKLEDKKRERLENETMTTLDAVSLAAMTMDKSWWDYVRDYVDTGSHEAALGGLRDAPFLQGMPGECLNGMVQEGVCERGWDVMKKVDFLSRPQKRRLWTAKRWIVHLYAGAVGHYKMFQLDEGDTVVIELDLERNKAHDIQRDPTWRMLMWGALTGKIEAVVGGPPGRSGLPRWDQKATKKDVRNLALVARMLWLYVVAEAARTTSSAAPLNRQRPVAFMVEHPAEENWVDGCTSTTSLWSTPTWRTFAQEMGMTSVTFDQSAMGATTTSTTTLGTNIYYLMGLDAMRKESADDEACAKSVVSTWSC
ncbi:unnamed protein product [Symbiodinium sp. CCMP2456]|nr:unnamed protein product [Symbiodinium sp. CCMP2456]